jgi:hypothetical protein
MIENFRFIGTTDECTECQHCGRTQLKNTVVLEVLDEDGNGGEFTYYGSSCAAKALAGSWTGAQVLAKAKAAQMKRDVELAWQRQEARLVLRVLDGCTTAHDRFDAWQTAFPQGRAVPTGKFHTAIEWAHQILGS